MGLTVWYMTALCLILAKGELYDDVSQSFYEKPESSSPAPPSPTPGLHLAGMKELVLYLTPEQAKVLQDAGAIVKPFPEFEREFLQQRQQQSVEEQNEPKYAATTPKIQPMSESELDEFYKVLNIQQINEDLAIPTPPAQQTTDKPHPKYKLNPLLKQQNYAASYVPKKANRNKTQSVEFVRYLPQYEFEDLKMEPYRAQSLPGYSFKDAQDEIAYQTYLHSKSPEAQLLEIQRPQENQEIQGVTPSSLLIKEATFSQQPGQSFEQLSSNMQDKGPVTFDSKVRKPSKPLKAAPIQETSKDWAPIQYTIQTREKLPSPVEIKTASEIELPLPQDAVTQFEKQEETPNYSIPEPTSAVDERHYSSLLAPLIQHQKITESIEQQKENLENNEREIQTKLKEIKDSGDSDEGKIAVELGKLNENLVKQNALAQKLAMETISKKPQAILKEQSPFKRRRPTSIELLKNIKVPTPVIVHVPKPIEVKAGKPYPEIVRKVPIPLFQPEKIEASTPIPVPVGEKNIPATIRNVFPFLMQKPIPEVKHEFPVNYAFQPEKLTIIRHIWEH